MTLPHGRMNSLSGVYPSSQVSHVSRAPSPWGLYSNNESSRFPRDDAGYNRTYGVIPMGDIEAYSNSVVGGQYRPNAVGNNMVFHDPYRSGMNEPSPIASERTMYYDYSAQGRPYSDNRGFRPDLHPPPSQTTCSYSPLFSLYFLLMF